MPTRLDKWLKGIDDFADLDTAEIEQLLTDLRAQLDSTQMKIAVLEQLLRRRRPRPVRHEPAATAGPSRNGRPSNWKRHAVLALLETQPNRVWSAADVRDALREAGQMTGDEGTPTKLLLDRLVNRGQVYSRGPDRFSLQGEAQQQIQ